MSLQLNSDGDTNFLVYINVVFYFLDNEYYFKRDNPYGNFEDGERIAFFSKAIVHTRNHIDYETNI